MGKLVTNCKLSSSILHFGALAKQVELRGVRNRCSALIQSRRLASVIAVSVGFNSETAGAAIGFGVTPTVSIARPFATVIMLIVVCQEGLEHTDDPLDDFERTGNAYSGSNAEADGGTGSFRIEADRDSDYGSKTARLNECRTAIPDSSQFNLFCQGPKVKDGAGEFAVGDQFSHYRHWSLEKGGEYPRLPNQVNGVCATNGECEDFVGQILVDDADWAYATTDPSTDSTKYYRPYSKKDPSGADCTTGTD